MAAAAALLVAGTLARAAEPLPVFVRQWGATGHAPGELWDPRGISVGPTGDVYVASTGDDRVVVFDSTGVFLRQWGTTGTGPGGFHYPTDIEVDDAGNVFVVDADNTRIQKFSTSGTFLLQWGTSGIEPGQLISPFAIGCGP